MKRLLLLGGGHAHLFVLDALARHPLAGVEVWLLTPFARQIYSGMLPGWIAGHYPIEACELALAELAARAGVRLVLGEAVALDLATRRVRCADGSEHDFDWLSIDTGSRSAVEAIRGAREHALPVRPIETFIGGVERLLQQLREARELPLAIVGGGVAAVELAFALHHRLAREGLAGAPLTVIGSGGLPLEGFSGRLQWKCHEMLAERGITWHAGSPVAALDGRHAVLADGTRIAAAGALLATGAGAPAWPAQSGLACDAAGFVRVRASLQSVSHDFVFAAGDIAALPEPRPKAGVFAVRAGPYLAANLRRAVAGETLTGWRPPRHALLLVSAGGRYALAAWGPFGTWGAWVWRWKDRVDRGFMRRFGNPHVG